MRRSTFCKDRLVNVPVDFTREEEELVCIFIDDDVSHSLLPVAPLFNPAAAGGGGFIPGTVVPPDRRHVPTVTPVLPSGGEDTSILPVQPIAVDKPEPPAAEARSDDDDEDDAGGLIVQPVISNGGRLVEGDDDEVVAIVVRTKDDAVEKDSQPDGPHIDKKVDPPPTPSVLDNEIQLFMAAGTLETQFVDYANKIEASKRMLEEYRDTLTASVAAEAETALLEKVNTVIAALTEWKRNVDLLDLSFPDDGNTPNWTLTPEVMLSMAKRLQSMEEAITDARRKKAAFADDEDASTPDDDFKAVYRRLKRKQLQTYVDKCIETYSRIHDAMRDRPTTLDDFAAVAGVAAAKYTAPVDAARFIKTRTDAERHVKVLNEILAMHADVRLPRDRLRKLVNEVEAVGNAKIAWVNAEPVPADIPGTTVKDVNEARRVRRYLERLDQLLQETAAKIAESARNEQLEGQTNAFAKEYWSSVETLYKRVQSTYEDRRSMYTATLTISGVTTPNLVIPKEVKWDVTEREICDLMDKVNSTKQSLVRERAVAAEVKNDLVVSAIDARVAVLDEWLATKPLTIGFNPVSLSKPPITTYPDNPRGLLPDFAKCKEYTYNIGYILVRYMTDEDSQTAAAAAGLSECAKLHKRLLLQRRQGTTDRLVIPVIPFMLEMIMLHASEVGTEEHGEVAAELCKAFGHKSLLSIPRGHLQYEYPYDAPKATIDALEKRWKEYLSKAESPRDDVTPASGARTRFVGKYIAPQMVKRLMKYRETVSLGAENAPMPLKRQPPPAVHTLRKEVEDASKAGNEQFVDKLKELSSEVTLLRQAIATAKAEMRAYPADGSNWYGALIKTSRERQVSKLEAALKPFEVTLGGVSGTTALVTAQLPDLTPPKRHSEYPKYFEKLNKVVEILENAKRVTVSSGEISEVRELIKKRDMAFDAQVQEVKKAIVRHENYVKNAIAPPTVKTDERYAAIRVAPMDGGPCGEGFVRGNLRDLLRDSKVGDKIAPKEAATIAKVVWNSVVLHPDTDYCLPYALVDEIRNNTSCDWRLGNRVVIYRPETGTTEYTCECKYPDLFSGPACNRQVACVQADDSVSNIAQYTPFWDRLKLEALNHEQLVERSVEKPEVGLYEVLPDGYPRYTCKCNHAQGGRKTVNIHPLVCLPDPCFPATPLEYDFPMDYGLRHDKNACSCRGDTHLSLGGDTACIPHQVAMQTPFVLSNDADRERAQLMSLGKSTATLYLNRFSNMDANTGGMLGPVTYYGIPKRDDDMRRVAFERVKLQCHRCTEIKTTMQRATGIENMIHSPDSSAMALLKAEANVVFDRTESICSATPFHFWGKCEYTSEYDAKCTNNKPDFEFTVSRYDKGTAINHDYLMYDELRGFTSVNRCNKGYGIVFTVNNATCAERPLNTTLRNITPEYYMSDAKALHMTLTTGVVSIPTYLRPDQMITNFIFHKK